MRNSLLKRGLVIEIILSFIGSSIVTGLNTNSTNNSQPIAHGNWLNGGEDEYINHSDIQTTKNLTYNAFKDVTYTEQPPPPPSEWDGIYEKYTLVSQKADIHYNQESQDGSTNQSKYGMKYKLKDRCFDTYYETHDAFNITNNPCFFWFNFPKATNISLMRFYFYNPKGIDFAPAVYEIYNSSAYVATYNITPMVNGQWVRVNFTHDIVRTMNFTLKIIQTRGSIDHPNENTKIVINELELFENTTPQKYIQEAIPLYEGTSKFWNGLDWAISLRIDDCWNLSLLPGSCANILPVTAMCYNPSSTIDVSIVDIKHVEVGSHGNIVDHTANYNKDYNWWLSKAAEAKESIESHMSKISIWSDNCISFAIPYSVMDPPGGLAFLDTDFKCVGFTAGPGWKLRSLGRQNISIYTVSEPKSQVPMDWMFTYPTGHVKVPWDYENTLKLKENHSYAILYGHPTDELDQNFTIFIENDTTGWHCTLGEMTSYWLYKERMNVTYNTSSNDTEKIFDINILEDNQDIWEVPITFTFNLTDLNWSGNIVVKWRNNNTDYTNKLKNISEFFPGAGQHTNQTMREGYRWDSRHHILYISVKPGDRDRPKSLSLSFRSNHPPDIPEKPLGPTSGKINVNYTYTTKTTDLDGDQVYYLWDWGDGNTSGWLGPYNSGVPCEAKYIWNEKRGSHNYNIKVKAKDIYKKESDWSDPLPITMPYSFDTPILHFLELLFQRFPYTFPILRHRLGY
jgi:hypothetical protein